ncbi:hypothetical protein PC116_g23831 [Phytophthora cactorum]|nr:hypothetical protein PC116_g23831 [Phytophthora cactorum]
MKQVDQEEGGSEERGMGRGKDEEGGGREAETKREERE